MIEEKEIKMVGEITDRIYDKEGNLIKEINGHNIVVNSFLKLVMSLLKEESGYSGVSYWAVGSGQSSWDVTMPNPAMNEVKLTNEVGRVPINLSTDVKFLNEDFTESQVPTRILQIQHTFGTSDCIGSWREFALFGGNATSSANSGIMINKRHHPVITKTSDISVQRTMRFTLTLE